jgi:hypothetical protein
MRFVADNHFVIGANHVAAGTPCQDYASSGIEKDVAFAIVSDGCSKGARTDVGSRIMVLTTQAAVINHPPATELASVLRDPNEINQMQRLLMGTAGQVLGLGREDLLATSVLAHLTQEGGFVHIRGDGVVARVYSDGLIVFNRYDWALNSPFYPIYPYADEGNRVFISHHGGDLDAVALTEVVRTYKPNGECVEETRQHTLGEGIHGITIPISISEIEEGGLEFVAVFTDGVTQVEGVEWYDAAKDLLAFKSLEGEFATRRMIKFLKTVHAYGKGPLDDLAYAVIQLRQKE